MNDGSNRSALIIDDEPQIRRAVRNALKDQTDRVIEASTGAEGVNAAAAERPALIILDLGLPDMEGMSVCREIRKWSTAPILVLSARHSEEEKVALLDAGADDYITKPFSTQELQARVRAHLRRLHSAGGAAEVRIDADDLVIDIARRRIWRGGAEIHLTPIEWDLLRALASEAEKTLTHQYLFRRVWTHSAGDPQQSLRVHIANLRRKIERDPVRPRLIITEPGCGYRFQIPAEVEP